MKNYFGRMVLLVEDYAKAFEFYKKNFGFVAIYDATTEDGRRYLHIGTDSTDKAGIWFMKIDAADQSAYVGNQAAGHPALVIYTDSLAELYTILKNNQVRIKIEPVETASYKFLHCFDLYGNEIIVAELN